MSLTKKQIANRKKWVEALRSGKFKQGKGKLKVNNKFCCQGVACELFKDDVDGEWGKNPLLSHHEAYHNVKFFKMPDESHAAYDAIWPDEIADLLGISEMDANQLVAMNDGAGPPHWINSYMYGHVYTSDKPATFEEIADAIELLTLAGL